jgi:glutamate dehydrogenase (NAD(P)+)
MIPKLMESYLREVLPERTWRNRLVRENGRCFMDFGPMDVERLNRLGIQPDTLGPKHVACMWDEETPLEVGGYLVVDNLSMGRPAMGGIRILPDLRPADVHQLARTMTMKNAAADLPYGGGKAGIVVDNKALSPEQHAEIVRRFARLLHRYSDLFLPGPDVGTTAVDMETVAIENGLDDALLKPAEMGGTHGEQIGAAGGGLVIAIQALINQLPRLRALPQFANLEIPDPDQRTFMFQGFGAVGAQTGRILVEQMPGARVIGVSDSSGWLYDPFGLPVEQLFNLSRQLGYVSLPFYEKRLAGRSHKDSGVKFGNEPNDLLREEVFCFIPAAPISNYLDTEASTNPSITVDRMGRWMMIVEGANTYHATQEYKTARLRMEREVYRKKGILIATDFLVNSGGVIYAAQEHLIKTPAHLRIPEEMLGNRAAVEGWLAKHAEELAELGEKRRKAGEQARQETITRNMRELIDHLISDPDRLPSEAAESISIGRMAGRERLRTAGAVMQQAITIASGATIQDASRMAYETGCQLLVITSPEGELAGVVTDWDFTRAMSESVSASQPVDTIMTRVVISATPEEPLIEVVRKLEHYEISALPVVRGNKVVGVVSTDLLARRSLYPLLLGQKS